MSTTWPAIEAASRQLGVHLLPALEVRKTDDLDGAFARAARERTGGMLVQSSAFFGAHTERIVSLAAKSRLPAIYDHRDFVEPGGLMSYGPDIRGMFRLMANYADKILRGLKPGDLPVEQPTKLELVINMKAAKALGLAIPQSLLVQAAEVIE